MNKLPPCDHDCCPPTHCELDRLKAENARLRGLLGPIEDVLETCEALARAAKGTDLALECDTQLTRLRAALEAKP